MLSRADEREAALDPSQILGTMKFGAAGVKFQRSWRLL